jgi:hypothetical protein
MTIDDITIQQYFTLEDTTEYDIYINILNPVNRFAGRSCITANLTFDEIEVIKQIFAHPTIDDIKDMFITCFRIKGSMRESEDTIFWEQSIFDLFRAKAYLQSYIKEIVDREVRWFHEEPNERMQMINAGERSRPFAHTMKKISLAQQFSTTPDEIGNWTYMKVFSYMIANKVKDDIARDYNDIK